MQIGQRHRVWISPCSCLAEHHQVGIANGQRPQAVISSKEAAVSCYSYIWLLHWYLLCFLHSLEGQEVHHGRLWLCSQRLRKKSNKGCHEHGQTCWNQAVSCSSSSLCRTCSQTQATVYSAMLQQGIAWELGLCCPRSAISCSHR